MLKIGDFSKLGQVSVRTLRHYDDLGLLKPAMVDRFTDYRFYTIDQLPRLNRILALKDLGFSLEQIRDLMRSNLSADQLQGMLLLKQAEIEREVREQQQRLRRVQARLSQIAQEGRVSPYEVVLKATEPQPIASIRQMVPTVEAMGSTRHEMYDAVYGWLEAQGVAPTAQEFVIYHAAEYTETDIDTEVAIGLDRALARRLAPLARNPIQVREMPAMPLVASVIHQGFLWEVLHAIAAIFQWMDAHGYAVAGPFREVHLFGSEAQLPKAGSTVVMEVQLPVEPAQSPA